MQRVLAIINPILLSFAAALCLWATTIAAPVDSPQPGTLQSTSERSRGNPQTSSPSPDSPTTGAKHSTPAESAAPKPASDSNQGKRDRIEGVWVRLDNKRLFRLYSRVGSFSAADRALLVSKRILDFAEETSIPVKSIKVVDSDSSTDIKAGAWTLATITEKDAHFAGRPRRHLARSSAETIKTALIEFRRIHSRRSLLFGILYSVLATAGLVMFGFATYRAYRILFPRLCVSTRRITVQSSVLLSSAQITVLIRGLVRLLFLGLLLVAFYAYLTIIFSFYPATRDVAETLLNTLVNQLAKIGTRALAALPDLLIILFIAAITRYVIRATRFVFREIGQGRITVAGFSPDWAETTFKLVRILVFVLAAAAMFPYIPGSGSPAFQGVSVFVGVLFSLGSTTAIANMVAGVVLTYMAPFRAGDRVSIANSVGDVIEKSLLVTRIRTIKNEEITIPNSLVMGSHIINYSAAARTKGLILHSTVTIGYDISWQKVHELLIAAAVKTEHIESEPPPFVLQTSLDNYYVSYEVNAYTDDPQRMAVTYSDLHQNIQNAFFEAGVEIMSPNYSALRDGNAVAIPAERLPKGYNPPGFRIENGK